jgi:plasmid stabilization system protein ParE
MRCHHALSVSPQRIHWKGKIMPKGDKSAYTDKQKRQAEHIEEGYEKRGVPAEEAKRRAWATENKVSGGGKKSGSGRAH